MGVSAVFTATILTDDSMNMLPTISWDGERQGKGFTIEASDSIRNTLSSNGLGIPSNDIENEESYKRVLGQYVRPAKYMFSGLFTEVRGFWEELNGFIPTRLLVLSSRYGLLHGEDEIIPYFSRVNSIHDLRKLETRMPFIEGIAAEMNKSFFKLLFLPLATVHYLIKVGTFERLDDSGLSIIVAGRSIEPFFRKEQSVMFLGRNGVARIGRRNCRAIMEKIESIVKGSLTD